MALIKCPDCNETVSSTAVTCIKCGRQLKYWTPGRIILALLVLPLVFVIASWAPSCFSGSFGPEREPLKYATPTPVPTRANSNVGRVSPAKTPMFQGNR